jgi:hypothetical protein
LTLEIVNVGYDINDFNVGGDEEEKSATEQPDPSSKYRIPRRPVS